MNISTDRNNRILVCCDLSNFEYFTIFGAFSKWVKKDKTSSSFLGEESDDPYSLPDILVNENFRKELHKSVYKRFDIIDWFLKKYHQNEIDYCDGIDFVFTADNTEGSGFRRNLYPEYKGQRKLIKRQFNLPLCKKYIENVIFKESNIEKYGYKVISVEGAESDDIIAVIMENYNDYMLRIIISSDKDFLQIQNVKQYSFYGDEVLHKIKGRNDPLTEKEFLLFKIIRGDVSDNIPSIAPKIGEKTAYKYVKQPKLLKEFLNSRKDATERFILNKKLIDFNSIPNTLKDKIIKNAKPIMDSFIVKKDKSTFKNVLEL